MAVFSQHITIKYEYDSSVSNAAFKQLIKPDNGLFGIVPGELAMVQNNEGVTLMALDSSNNVIEVRPEIYDLPGVYIDRDNLNAGDVIIYDPSAGPRGGWVNSPAPFPDLSGNSIFDLGDVFKSAAGNQILPGETLIYNGFNFRPGKSPEMASIGDLFDTFIFQPQDGHALYYDNTTGKWLNGYLPSDLNSLTDVDLDTVPPVDGDVLIYDGIRRLWEGGAVAGGNANVEIIDETEPFPDGEFKTLGVSPLEGDGSGGNFFWVNSPDGNSWAQAKQEGTITFDDFKNVDLTGLKAGETLMTTWDGTNLNFVPTEVLKPGFMAKWQPDPGNSPDTSYRIDFVGEVGATYYCMTDRKENESQYMTSVLGMYGESETYSNGIHFVDTYKDDLGGQSCVFVPEDLQPDGFGRIGIRPFSFVEDGIDILAGQDGFTAEISFAVTEIGMTCTIADLGHFKIKLFQGTLRVEVTDGNQTWGETMTSYGSIPANVILTVGVCTNTVFFADNKYFYCTIDGVLVNAIQDGTHMPGFVEFPTLTGQAVPAFGIDGFSGAISGFELEAGDGFYSNFSSRPILDRTLPVCWPTVNGLGRIIASNGRGARLISWEYDPTQFNTQPIGQPQTPIGSAVPFTDLPDVNEDYFTSGESGVVHWDSVSQKFITKPESQLEWRGEYTLTGASDVNTRADDGTFLPDGGVLAWDDFNNRFRPVLIGDRVRLNDAADVDVVSNGPLSQDDVLRWDDASQMWINAPSPAKIPGAIEDLTDVDFTFQAPLDGDTLVWSTAADAWVPGRTPESNYNKLSELEDVDTSGVNDNDLLKYDALNQEWIPSKSPEPIVIDDLYDVDTTSNIPKPGQILAWKDDKWRPSYFLRGGANSIDDLSDVNTRNKRVGQGLVWNGRAWTATELASGRGDAGDFDITFTATGFVSGVFGGGDFDLTGPDLPVERLAQFAGGGDFD